MDLYIQRRRVGVTIVLIFGLELILTVGLMAVRIAVGGAEHDTRLAMMKILIAMMWGVFFILVGVYIMMRRKESARKKPTAIDPESSSRRASPHHPALAGGASAAPGSSFYGASEGSPNRAAGTVGAKPSSYRQAILQNPEELVVAPQVQRPSLSAWVPVVCLLLLVAGLGVGFYVYQSANASLFDLIASGQVDALNKQLSQSHRDLNTPNKNGMTPLMAAVESENVAMVEALLSARAEVNRVDSKGRSPLIVATGNPVIMEMLLQQGADVSYADAERMTALHWAVRKQSVAAVRILLQNDAPVNVRDLNFDTPLLIAVKNGFKDVDLLLMHGADPLASDQFGETPLHHAAETDALVQAQALLTAGAEPVVFSRQGWSPLHTACRNGSLSVAALLLKAQVPVDIENRRKQTPLECAVQKNDAAVITFLLKRGADVEHVDRNGNTALHLALANGDIEAARVLIDAGADLDVTNDAGLSPRELMESHAPSLLLHLKTAAAL